MRRDHSSFSEFLDFAARDPLTSAHGQHTSRSGRSGWSGTESFGHAMQLIREGWKEGREAIERHRASFSSIIGSRIRRAVLAHEVAGFAPDVGAFLQGDPENMFAREYAEQEGPGRVVHVVVNGAVSADISKDQIMRRGALICALVDALESAGYSCRLTAVFCGISWAGGESATDLVPVKSAGEPLELDRLAFVFAHASMFRRVVFSAWEQDTPFMKAVGASYGQPEDVPKPDRGDLYLGTVFSGNVQNDQVIPWFKAQLAPLGITFDE